MSEAEILTAVRLAIGREPDAAFWRNGTGLAHFNGRPTRFGLCVGSSDLIGIVAGRFVALELKTPIGRLTAEQRQFLDIVRRLGGFAAVVRSPEEARTALARCRAGESE